MIHSFPVSTSHHERGYNTETPLFFKKKKKGYYYHARTFHLGHCKQLLDYL